MKIFKFKYTWRQEKREALAQDDESRIVGYQRVEGVINVVAPTENMARFFLHEYWKHYPWLERQIIELVSEEPVYYMVPHIASHEGAAVSSRVIGAA